MDIKENYSLKELNTFGLDVKAKYFSEFNTIEELRELLKLNNGPLLILGGGSNVLFTGDFSGLVLNNKIKGIEILRETEDHVYIKAGAGEVWHYFVMFCVEKNYGGVENLSLIPGSVGAGPMQNIGAYGVELKEVFQSLEAIELSTGELREFHKEECKFGYRYSIFKDEAKGKFVITSVTFKLNKKPVFNTSYGAIESRLKEMGAEPSVQNISEAVCYIRKTKLPDPKVLGNAGSFFKNPEIPEEKFDKLKTYYPDIVGYKTTNGIKLAAGWLIEQCGWKGKQVGNCGMHKNQALVLVNYGGARGNELVELARNVQKSVKQKYDVELEPEVNII